MTDKQTIDMYLKQGINIVPIAKGDGKALKMSGWDRYCNEKYIETIPTDQDFAVMMGKASDNLVCLDFDHCDSLEVLNDVIPDCLNKSLVVRSGNGYHIYLRTTDIATKDDGKPIALTMDGQSVTLEPGGQFELSGAPLETIHETCIEVDNHLKQE